MLILAGLGSFFIGASLQTTMPAFADRFGTGGGIAYSALLLAVGAAFFLMRGKGGDAPGAPAAAGGQAASDKTAQRVTVVVPGHDSAVATRFAPPSGGAGPAFRLDV